MLQQTRDKVRDGAELFCLTCVSVLQTLTVELEEPGSLLGKLTNELMTTSTIPQLDLLVTHQPAEAGELHVVSTGGLDCDVPAVPVILHPVLLLLNLHQHNLTQVLPHSHIIGVHLQFIQQLNQ